MRMPVKFLAAALIAASAPLLAGSASAAPLSGSLALKNTDVAASIETVQWRGRRGGYWRGGRGVGLGLGVGAGLLLGGALAAQPYYGYGPGYYGYGYDSGYDSGYVAVAPGAVGGDAVGYCQQRFRSYDARSGTYLGYDGLRHPCP